MPWIFLCLMLANAVYFGWKFMEGPRPRVDVAQMQAAQPGKTIVLLSERAVPKKPAQVAESAPDPAPLPAVAAAPGPACFHVGPFATEAASQSFVAAVRSATTSVRLDKRKVDGMDYWVFVPSFTNRERAEERLRELKVRGIEGFVVREGRFINAISLNHFSRSDLADAYLQKMKAAGVVVESRATPQPRTELWLYLTSAPNKPELRQRIDARLADHDELRRENAACED